MLYSELLFFFPRVKSKLPICMNGFLVSGHGLGRRLALGAKKDPRPSVLRWPTTLAALCCLIQFHCLFAH